MPADILIVGEAPGKVELEELRPFVGRSGKLLDSLLYRAGLSRDQIRITNTCGCVDMTREIKKPLPAELDACRPRLLEEIAATEPKVVLLMGNTALAEFFPGFKVGEVYNRMRHNGTHYLMPTYRPSAALRNPHLQPVILEALERVRSI